MLIFIEGGGSGRGSGFEELTNECLCENDESMPAK